MVLFFWPKIFSKDFQSKSMEWFLYDNGLCHERVNKIYRVIHNVGRLNAAVISTDKLIIKTNFSFNNVTDVIFKLKN